MAGVVCWVGGRIVCWGRGRGVCWAEDGTLWQNNELQKKKKIMALIHNF